MRGIIAGIALLAVLSFAGRAEAQVALKDVQKVYVGDMGKSDEAERFRLLLADELERNGFGVVEREESADAALAGVLTVRVYDDGSVARVTVRLASGDQRLWSRDFQQRIPLVPLVGILKPSTTDGRDTVRARAQDVAKSLREAVTKAGK